MPVTPSHLRRPILIRATVVFDEETEINVLFNRNQITDAWFRTWTELEGQRDATGMNDALADLIHDWDVVNEDGTPFPPTPDNIGFLFTLPDKGKLMQVLFEAAKPSDAEGKALSAPSSTPLMGSTEQQLPSLNGPTTSPSPAPSASPSLT